MSGAAPLRQSHRHGAPPSREGRASRALIGRPPVPHEHGAWVMLYAPMVIALASLPPVAWGASLFLALAVTGLFLGRNALGLLLRRRGGAGTGFWLGVYLLGAAAGALPLFLLYHRWALLIVGGLAAGLFALHALLLVLPARKRLDRSQWGEVLAVGALTLTAPAAYVVARGHLDPMAWCLWAACTLYFSSSVFFVKMLLAAVKVRGDFGPRERWRAGRDCVIYHALLALTLVLLTVRAGGDGPAVLAAVAYGPVLVRAFLGWMRLSNRLPPLRRVGVGETLYSLWFTGFFLGALRIGS